MSSLVAGVVGSLGGSQSMLVVFSGESELMGSPISRRLRWAVTSASGAGVVVAPNFQFTRTHLIGMAGMDWKLTVVALFTTAVCCGSPWKVVRIPPGH